ncbi:18K peptidoglycan-associated outer membrane lipoprotein [Labilithrix luteola]|uniref:18K peptidoglycan-associated outer membrane lipoprotein n=1 Tax=Labilithrix luteola TaxID=1391654 RepID=A0A0K1Q9S7_9BACT|nr:OmpA family protein [Labilithrix luteola]AKV02494.1 18K peptidoglycan-associated outer membrane lipoprotein [Labilithrix luteola]
MLSRFCLLGLLSLGLVAGCDSPGFSSKNAKSAADANKNQPAVGQTTTTASALPPSGAATGSNGPDVQTAGLSVSDEIAKACGIPARPTGQAYAPSFDFDSATLVEEDRTMLATVARCLTEGALKGRSVSLVGRADARGEPEYNMTLGESRADTVRRYMQDLGVARDKLQATSRGELDAVGTNEEGYKQDRRVDVRLVN